MNSERNNTVASAPRRISYLLARIAIYLAIACILLAGFYVPRQFTQRKAIAELKRVNAQTRTQPIALPFVSDIFGAEYCEEVVETYLVGPSHSDQDLEIVQGLSSLQKLELSGSEVTSAGLVKLAGLKNLYTLHLANTKVDDSGLKSLSGLRNLGILSLSNTKVSDAGIGELRSMPNLEMLSLDGTAITDAAMQVISQMVNLKELILTRTKVSDSGAELIKSLKKLERLKIHETQVSLEKMKEISEALPNCAVLLPTANE